MNSEDVVKKNESVSPGSVLSQLLYGLSLPERIVRSAVGVTAGTAKEIADFLIPEAFQDSTSYQVAVRNSLGFLVSGVGTLASQNDPKAGNSESEILPVPVSSQPGCEDTAADSPGAFIARKAAGNFIDIAGLATLHVSPLWVLAIVSDVAYGTKSYVAELAAELQKQGLIDDTSTIHRVDDLLDAVKKTSGTAASTFETPPLSLDELRQSVEQTRQALRNVDPTQLIPEAEIRRYWDEMKQIASQEHVSLLGVSGAVAMQTIETIRDVSSGTMTGLFVAGQIVNRNIFMHYANALTGIREQGIWTSVRNTYEPYVDLAWSNFMSCRKTWTEQVLDPGRFARFWAAVRKLFARKPATQHKNA